MKHPSEHVDDNIEMTHVDPEELTPVCPDCGEENTVEQEHQATFGIPVVGFRRDAKGTIVPEDYGAWDFEYIHPNETGRYICSGCDGMFRTLDSFFWKRSSA